MKIISTIVVLLAMASISVADTRREFWNRFVGRKFAQAVIQQEEEAVCPVAPRTYACKSARLETDRKHQYIHVCPKDGSTEDVCFNTKLPRCCPSDLASGQWKCFTTTTLKVSGRTVQVKVHRKSGTSPDGDKHCIAFDDAHEDAITQCCEPHRTGKEKCLPKPPPVTCVQNRDIYFVIDSTDSINDDMFCRFGYILQLIVAAVNPRGPTNGARVAAILFTYSRKYNADFLFNLDDVCSTIVSDNIKQVVYEYYWVDRGMQRESLQYPNVRADITQPSSALFLAYETIKSIPDRSALVITLTDGISHQDVSHAVKELRKVSDPLIAAGIGKDVDVPYLANLASNVSFVVYEEDKNNVIGFGKSIIEKMRDAGALCADEAARILAALNAESESDMDTYCSTCMWKVNQPMSSSEREECSQLEPRCGSSNLQMQAFPNQVNMKQRLEGELIAALEGVLDRAG